MKRIAVLIASLVTAALVSVAAPAHADDCLTVPGLPGECLSQATYDHIRSLEADRDEWHSRYDQQVTLTWQAEGYATSLREQLWDLADDLQAQRAATSVARSELAIALEQIDLLNHRVTRLRARIKQLKAAA